jgi:hypothetical protein
MLGLPGQPESRCPVRIITETSAFVETMKGLLWLSFAQVQRHTRGPGWPGPILSSVATVPVGLRGSGSPGHRPGWINY